MLVAVCAPLLTSYDPIAQDLTASLQPPGDGHLLGTDQLGRDVCSRLLYGARVDLRVGALAVLFPFVIGGALGLHRRLARRLVRHDRSCASSTSSSRSRSSS